MNGTVHSACLPLFTRVGSSNFLDPDPYAEMGLKFVPSLLVRMENKNFGSLNDQSVARPVHLSVNQSCHDLESFSQVQKFYHPSNLHPSPIFLYQTFQWAYHLSLSMINPFGTSAQIIQEQWDFKTEVRDAILEGRSEGKEVMRTYFSEYTLCVHSALNYMLCRRKWV